MHRIIFLLFLLSSIVAISNAATFPGIPDTTWSWSKPNGIQVEPSGIVYHPGLDRVIIVHDNGYISQHKPDTGETIDIVRLRKEDGVFSGEVPTDDDMEAVTYADEASSVVYIGLERTIKNSPTRSNAIWEYDVEARKVTRIFDINDILRNTITNKGIETLTFVPDSNHSPGKPSGLQEDGKTYKIKIDLTPGSEDTTVTAMGSFSFLNINSDVAGADWDRGNKLLYILHDGQKKMGVGTKEGKLCETWDMFQKDIEGVALKGSHPNSEIYFAIDTGGVKKFQWPFDPSTCTKTGSPPTTTAPVISPPQHNVGGGDTCPRCNCPPCNCEILQEGGGGGAVAAAVIGWLLATALGVFIAAYYYKYVRPTITEEGQDYVKMGE